MSIESSLLQFEESQNPWQTFHNWYQAAASTSLEDPNAMVLSTANSAGEVSSRVVLCKEVRTESLVFYTNYDSKKGRDIAAHPQVALCFFWEPLYRQVRIQGVCRPTDRATSESYWKTRPRERQLSQYVSRQSAPLVSKSEMTQAIQAAEARFQNGEIPCPTNWGGYEVIPQNIELWVGSRGRFHDRFAYTKVQNNWVLERLYP